MKKSVLFTTTAATLGLATVLTFAAVSPSMAKGSKHSNDGSSSATAKPSGISFGPGAVSGDVHVAPKTASLTFTLTNVPSVYTDAAALGKKLVIRVVPLAADATSAPATPPVPPFGGPKFGSDDVRPAPPAGAPAFGKGHGHGPDGDGDHGGQFTLTSGDVHQAPPVGAPAPGTAPSFGTPDNDGDGPAFGGHHGRGPRGNGGNGPFGQASTFTLTGNTLTGSIQIPAARAAGVQNWAVYISVAADSSTGLAAQSGTPVFVVATTDASGNVTLGSTSGSVTIDLSKNTGTAK